MAYDSARQKVVLFGGSNGLVDLSDTWEFDGAAWTQVNLVVHPPSKGRAAMAFDSARSRVVMFGGITAGAETNETWEFDGTAWQLISTPLTPPARARHAMEYDATRTRLVLFGGDVNDVPFADTWEYDGVTWSPRASSMSPPGRWQHGMAFDVTRNQTVLFGGDANGGNFADTWLRDASGWHQVTVSGPAAREDHAMATFGRCAGIVMFGAIGSFGQDTWLWNGTSWAQINAVVAPAMRRGHRMVYDSANDRVVLFGGSDSTGTHRNDTWVLGTSSSPICAAWSSFGSGCMGPNGTTPALVGVAGALPRLGADSRIRVGNLPLVPVIPVFVFGRSNTANSAPSYPLPFDLGVIGWPGCTQLVAADVSTFAITTTGSAEATIDIPNDPMLAGQDFYGQALVLYFPVGTAVSNGVHGSIGY